MRYEEKRMTLADGTIVFVKSPQEDEAQAALDYLTTVTGETSFLSAMAGERELTVEQERNWLKAELEAPNEMQIAAFKDGRLIGMTGISGTKSGREMHRASLGIAVVKDFWGLGLGTLLMREAISAAQRMGYEYLDLKAFKRNERAFKLYQKYGFTVYGTHEKGYKYPDGTYDDELLMTLELGN